MSAMTKRKVAFKLFKRDKNDLVKARAYLGNHDSIIKSATSRVCTKYEVHINSLVNL